MPAMTAMTAMATTSHRTHGVPGLAGSPAAALADADALADVEGGVDDAPGAVAAVLVEALGEVIADPAATVKLIAPMTA